MYTGVCFSDGISHRFNFIGSAVAFPQRIRYLIWTKNVFGGIEFFILWIHDIPEVKRGIIFDRGTRGYWYEC